MTDEDSNIQNLFLNTPIYEKFPYNLENNNKIHAILGFRGAIDCFCNKCQKDSTFAYYEEPMRENAPVVSTWTGRSPAAGNKPSAPERKIFSPTFRCTRDLDSKIQFFWLIDGTGFQKIGQYPSIADLSDNDIRKYKKVLEATEYSEFSKAIGLASHGIGIGSFVYLRRIFENVVERAHQKAKSLTPSWNEAQYAGTRMDQKIELLSTELPDFIVKNKALYSVVSKGIHELSEKECLSYFPVVRSGIELILDQLIEAEERIKKEKAVAEKLAELKGKHSS